MDYTGNTNIWLHRKFKSWITEEIQILKYSGHTNVKCFCGHLKTSSAFAINRLTSLNRTRAIKVHKNLGGPQYKYGGDVRSIRWSWIIIVIHVSCYRIPRKRSGVTSSRILEPCFEFFPWVPFVKRNGCWTKMIAKTFHVLRIKGKMEPELLQQKWDRDQTWCSPEF